MGREQDHLKLCHLRGLQSQAAQTDPAAAAVQRCKGQRDGQHGQHHPVQRLARPAQEAVIHIAHDYHTANANGHADSLLLDVVQAVAHAQVAGGVACAVQHYKAEHHDNGQRCQPVEQQPVPRSRVPLQRRHPCTFFLVFMLSAGGCHCHAPLFSESGAQAQRARRTASASPHTLSAHRL